MADSLGSDFSCVTDLDVNLAVVSGRTALAQALCRRLMTRRAGLWYAPNYGTDLRQFLNTAPVQTSIVEQAAENECLKDERVEDISATAEHLEARQTIQLKLRITEAGGTFDLTVLVSALTVELLQENL